MAANRTDIKTSARITSSWGFFLIRRRIEHFGLKRFQRQLPNTRGGVLSTVASLQPSSPLRARLMNGERVERQEDKDAMRLSGRLRGRLEELRGRARKRRRELESMLRGESATPSATLEDEVEEHVAEEDGEVPMTDEEHQELASLEKEEEEASASSSRSTAGSSHPAHTSRWQHLQSSWLWWFRWKLAGIERPAPN